MKTNFANIITLFRIILSIVLLFLKSFSLWFFVAFCFCGLTDMLDGFVARKLKIESDFGKHFDTIADIVFFVVAFYKIACQIVLPKWVIFWALTVAFVKLFALIKSKEFPHTFLNKFVGFGLFITVFLFGIACQNLCFVIMCSLGSLSAISEMIIAFKNEN